MTVTIIRPTSMEVVNRGLPSDIIVTGTGNVLNDGSDDTYITVTTRPDSGETLAPFARLRFEDVSIPSTDSISSIVMHFKVRSTSGAGLVWAPIDVNEFYDDDSSDYGYATISSSSSFIEDTGNTYNTTYSSQSWVSRNIIGGFFTVALTGENYWDTRNTADISEVWFEVTHDVAPVVTPPPVSPPNDLFANRIMLTGAAGTAGFDFTGASIEAGEPRIAVSDWQNASVWYEWLCPTDFPAGATLHLVADDPTLERDDGIWMPLWVYQGASLETGLTRVAFNNSTIARPPGYSWDIWTDQGDLYFKPTPGESYIFCVGAWSEYGPATISWEPGPVPPVNDNLDDAIQIVKDGPPAPVSFAGATVDANGLEPEWDWIPSSVWFKFVSSSSDNKIVLNLVAETDYNAEVYIYSRQPRDFAEWRWWGYEKYGYAGDGNTDIVFACQPNQTYYLHMIPDTAAAITSTGKITIAAKTPPPPPPPPENNTVDTAAEIDFAGTGQPDVDLAGATKEPGETVPYGSANRTSWYKWTAPESTVGKEQKFTVNVTSYSGSNYAYVGAAVYTGSGDVSSLTRVSQNYGYNTTTVYYTPTAAGQVLKIQVWDYYATSDSMKINVVFPRGGLLRVALDSDDDKVSDMYHALCSCGTKYDYENAEKTEKSVTFGQLKEDGYPITRMWSPTTLGGGSAGYMIAGYKPIQGEPALTAAVAVPPSWDNTASLNWPEATAIAGKPAVFYTTDQTTPVGAYANFSGAREFRGGYLKSVTIRALVESAEGVYISLSNSKFVESSGIGGKFTSPGGWSWVERTFDVTDRTYEERASWAKEAANGYSTYLHIWQRPNTGGHAVAKVYLTLTTEHFTGGGAEGRFKIKSYDPSGANPDGVWYVQKCCGDTKSGRPLKVKAGENDWRPGGCFVREPGPWIQLPPEEFVRNSFDSTMSNASIPHNITSSANSALYPSGFNSTCRYHGGFYGQKNMWRSAGGIGPDDDPVAVACAWNGARRGDLGSQWWSDGGYEQNGGAYVCYLTEGIFGGGFSHTYVDMPVGYAGTWAAGTFGAGFGDDAGCRIFTTLISLYINSLETDEWFARPVRRILDKPPGATIEWENYVGSADPNYQTYRAQARGELMSLQVAPDGWVGQTMTYPHGPLSPARWGVEVVKSTRARNQYGWGYAGYETPDGSGYGTGWYGGAAPTDYLNSLHHIADWEGGASPWYDIPEPMWREALDTEFIVGWSNTGGLLFHGYSPYLLSSDTPPGMWPVNNDYSYMHRSYCHIAIKFTVKPQRYRFTYPI